MTEKVYVLCATDENYAPYCGVMLTSVFENTPNAEAFVFLSNSLSKQNQKKYQQLEKQYNTSIHFIVVDKSHFAQMPMGLGIWTNEAYYRFAAPELLPKEIQKVIYLDCDIIVDYDLHELWATTINDNSALVVLDIAIYNKSLLKHLDPSYQTEYFNSGMMVINLKYWREHNIQHQLFESAINNADINVYVDQDVLNMVLKDTKNTLPLEYNFMPSVFCYNFYNTFPKEIKDYVLTHQPKIIHYTSHLPRPWHSQSYGLPFRTLWWKYAKKSPWKHMRETYPNVKRINWWIKRHFFMPLGLYLQNQKIVPIARNIK